MDGNIINVYYTPTKVVFGKDAEKQVGELIQEQGGKKVLVHFGGGSVKRSGLLDRIYESLDGAGVEYVSLGGVVPNPRLSLVYKGIELCKSEKVDFILAVGGGSVIDSSKAIGYGVANPDIDVWDIYDWKAKPQGCLPVGAVLTIAAAGSEMSDSSVITKDEGGIKRGTNSNFCRCRFAVMNPELTYTLPAYQTSCGVTDILMHTMERYFVTGDTMELTDVIAEGLMKTVIRNGKILMNNPEDYSARAEIMWAGSLSHNGLTSFGSGGDWATHQLEHELSGMFDVAHGAGLSAVWGAWARYVFMEKPERFASFAGRVFGVSTGNVVEDALCGIDDIEDVFKDFGMPVSIPQLLDRSLTDAEIEDLAAKCAHHDRTIGAFKKLNREDIRKIYIAANE